MHPNTYNIEADIDKNLSLVLWLWLVARVEPHFLSKDGHHTNTYCLHHFTYSLLTTPSISPPRHPTLNRYST